MNRNLVDLAPSNGRPQPAPRVPKDQNPPPQPPNPVSQPNRVPPADPFKDLMGIPPAATEASQFGFGEAISVTRCPDPKLFAFTVDHTLHYRKLYCWLWTNPSNAADYFVQCEISFWRANSCVGVLPIAEAVSAAANSVVPETMASLNVGSVGGAQGRDSIVIYPVNPTGTQATAIVLQPQCIYADIDEIRMGVKQMRNMTGIRLWLGCISSKAE